MSGAPVEQLHCQRCGHWWVPQHRFRDGVGRPAVCPRCKSRGWDRPPREPGKLLAAAAPGYQAHAWLRQRVHRKRREILRAYALTGYAPLLLAAEQLWRWLERTAR